MPINKEIDKTIEAICVEIQREVNNWVTMNVIFPQKVSALAALVAARAELEANQ